jgi:hypothetical protein
MKIIIINTVFVILYFTLFLMYALCYSSGGGDILILMLTGIALIVHLVVTIIANIKSVKNVFNALIGILIGVLICYIIFSFVTEYKLNKNIGVYPIDIQ